MPELSEVAIMAEFITKISKNVVFDKIEKSPESKVNTDLTLFGEDCAFTVSAKSRGKELMVTFEKIGGGPEGEVKKNLLMSMGMSGNWTLCKERAGGMYLPKHSHLRLYGMHTGLKQRIALCMVDTRRFAKWTWKEGFSAERGPCPVKEHDYFRANFITKVAHWPTKDTKLANAPALDIIMNQSIFNGIGNYLRAEIFYRADVNPFRSFSSYTHEQIERVLALCASVPLETMELGGGAIKDWSGEESSKERFYNWLQCYLKQSSLIDNGKRRFWYNPKWESTEEYLHYIYANRPEVLKLEKEIEESKKLKNKTVKAQDFETAAKLRDREKELTETLTDTLYALQTIDKANKMTNLHV